MIKLGNKKGLHSRRSSLFLLVFLSLFFVVIVTDLKYQYLGLTGFAVNILSQNSAYIEVDTSHEIGVIRDDFYGANTHGAYLGEGTRIDTNGDGVLDGPSDIDWHRHAWLDSGMKLMRWDADLEHYYSVNQTISDWMVDDLYSRSEQLMWAEENDINVLLIISFMPSWLADTSVEGCSSDRLSGCPPSNYSLWENMLIDYLDRLTLNETIGDNLIIEVWNEPDLGFWLSGLTTDERAKSEEYVKLYGSTYNILKSHYSQIKIGGPGISWIINTNITSSFFSNFSNKSDFFSLHRYTDNPYGNIASDTESAFNYYSLYTSEDKEIIWSEWNIWSPSTKSFPSNKSIYSSSLSLGYLSILNSHPSDVSMVLYQWSENEKYSATQHYNEYPQKWNMVSEPGLDNEYTPAYNVTKNFAHYHAGGDTVVSSSSNNANVKVVSSVKSNGEIYLTVISTATINTTAIVSFDNDDVYGLRDLASGQLYIEDDGVIELGVFSQYDVKHFVEVAAPVANDTTAPSITIITPQALEYSTSSITVSAQLNEQGYCTYTFNNGLSNKTMSTTNNLLFTASESLTLNGDYTIDLNCYDVSNNRANAERSFSILVVGNADVPAPDPGNGGSNLGGGGGGGGGIGDPALNTQESNSSAVVVGDSQTLTYENTPNYADGSSYVEDVDPSLNQTGNLTASKGIVGRAISAIESASIKGVTYIIIVLIVIGVLLFCIVAMVDAINVSRAKRQKYGALKDWIGDNHSNGYEHDHLKNVLMNNGWNEKLVDKAIDEHVDKLEDDKYRVPFGD